MSATRWLAGVCALVPLQGCMVTDKLWDEWGRPLEPNGPHMGMASSRTVPTEVVEAVRAGDGSHHLVVRMSNGAEHRFVIEGAVGPAPEGDAATIDSHRWPGTTTDQAALPVPRQLVVGAMPKGLPLAVAHPRAPQPWSRPPATPDPAMAVLIDAPLAATPDDPVIGLDDRKVVLTDPDGQVTVLAEFSPPPPRAALVPRLQPRRRPVARVVETSARVLLTPFALVTDVVIVAGCAVLLPFGLFFFFHC